MFHRMSALQLGRWQILTKEWFFKSKIGENVCVCGIYLLGSGLRRKWGACLSMDPKARVEKGLPST